MQKYSPKQIKLITENFQQAQKAIQANKLGRAEKHYLDILRVDPNITEAKNALAFVYTFTKEHQKAVSQLRSLLTSAPHDANLHHNLANNLYELGDYDNAITHYKSAIEYNPSLIDAYTQCGMVYLKLTQHDLALEYLNKAYAFNNDNPKVLHGLGISYAQIKEFKLALEFTLRAVKLAPNNCEYQLTLAKVLQFSDRAQEADIQYHNVCTRFPDYLDAFLAYGEILSKNRYYDEALECFKHAHKLAPQQTDISESIADIYLGLADVDMAIHHFQHALSQEPKRLSALLGIGQAYQESGKEMEAIELCDRIIKLDPNKPDGYILKSKVRKSTPDDGLSEELLRVAQLTSLSDADKIPLNFALGKVYDDQKKYAAAFQYYLAGNTLKAKDTEYDQAAVENQFSAIIDYFNNDFFEQHQHFGNSSELPIFIVGMPRSGTTLTEQIISSHPDVIGAGEVIYWSSVTIGMSKMLNAKQPYPACMEYFTNTHAQDISTRYESTLRKITGKDSNIKHITDKLPHNFLSLGLIASLFPNAKIIHTKRDAVDTCLSIFFQNFSSFHSYGIELARLGAYYKQYERIMQHWHSVLPGRIMDIHYSDTTSDPEYWSRQLIKHIGLEWSDACLAPHKLERSVKTASHWQVRQPIYKTSVERWRNYENHIQPLLEALN